MAAFRPIYSAKELKTLDPKKRKALKKAIAHHLKTHPQIRKILRQKTKTLYKQLKTR
jgi:hypothetical protein